MKINIHKMEGNDLIFVVIVAKYKGELIMVRHKDRTTYEIPGGHIEAGETPDQAAKRELFEETGALDFTLEAIGDYSVNDRYGRLYTADVKTIGPLPDSEMAEVIMYKEGVEWTYDQIQPFLLEYAEDFRAIRSINVEDASQYLDLMYKLDQETSYMLYEKNERQSSVKDFEKRIQGMLKNGCCYIHEKQGFNGFIAVNTSPVNKIKHIGYIVIGIVSAYGGRKIGTMFFNKVFTWAKANGIKRLELSVMVPNTAGVKLYEKMGFEIEGIKRKAIYMNNEYVDEYYMSKLL